MDTIDTIRLSAQPAGSSGIRRPFRDENFLARLLRFYRTSVARRRSRLALGNLNADELRDIGVTEAEARREAAMPFWR
ncbi:DUF1127 domain-containing protein [Ensifer sp. BR816]|uniref:DUF1127 domain-containing protein n=1 Tax=Rhizobium sp. (strain BR816) TaxID=1057002 RepID=UPI000A028551|nr:DUF1127 domain-containing protein [Ensifer sp. BR816]